MTLLTNKFERRFWLWSQVLVALIFGIVLARGTWTQSALLAAFTVYLWWPAKPAREHPWEEDR